MTFALPELRIFDYALSVICTKLVADLLYLPHDLAAAIFESFKAPPVIHTHLIQNYVIVDMLPIHVRSDDILKVRSEQLLANLTAYLVGDFRRDLARLELLDKMFRKNSRPSCSDRTNQLKRFRCALCVVGAAIRRDE